MTALKLSVDSAWLQSAKRFCMQNDALSKAMAMEVNAVKAADLQLLVKGAKSSQATYTWE